MPQTAPPTRVRRTQEERSASTRERLLDATIECLIDRGYAGTTTTWVAERAGLSRGAQLHHFPTKADLVINAVAHLAVRRGEEIRREAKSLPETADPMGQVLELIWNAFSGPLFYAALELWVAARTDRELHQSLVHLERGIGRSMALLWGGLAGDLPGDRRFSDALELSLYLVRGMALQKILRDDDTQRRRLFELWKQLVAGLLSQPDASAPSPEREEQTS